jgi:hypothetical protein
VVVSGVYGGEGAREKHTAPRRCFQAECQLGQCADEESGRYMISSYSHICICCFSLLFFGFWYCVVLASYTNTNQPSPAPEFKVPVPHTQVNNNCEKKKGK